jgi:hypothetical protein
LRRYTKVLGSPAIKRAGFDASNTIVIDAEARKVRKCVKNAIVVAEYTAVGRHGLTVSKTRVESSVTR